ncbi:MAG: hypothetical protein JXA54_04800 [Candidatus Heimdallarchaeota archaeon]|nr:hypothetical protein [Candidatus Heimdallarchaeota archaeon]
MTLYIGFVLHIYQPPTQKPTILKKIISESYQPLIDLLNRESYAKMTFNINGSLLELLDFYQEDKLMQNINSLVKNKQIDLLGSSCYHAILPLIPEDEINRQIQLNEQQITAHFGDKALTSRGFWLPEMAYDFRIIEPLEKMNYTWTIISSVATPTEELPDNYIPMINDNFIIYFRNDLLSNLISFKRPSVEEFYQEMKGLKDPSKEDYYLILAMDGETYGHHVKGLIEDFLEPLIHKIKIDTDVQLIKIADLPLIFNEKKYIIARSSTWSTSEDDLQRGVPFPLWSDPENHIHNLQLTVMNHTLYLVSQAETKCKIDEIDGDMQEKFTQARNWLDKGLHSCQLWWASRKPWYSSEMILKGLNQLIIASSMALKVILFNCNNEEEKNKALRIFDEIFDAQKEIYLIV